MENLNQNQPENSNRFMEVGKQPLLPELHKLSDNPESSDAPAKNHKQWPRLPPLDKQRPMLMKEAVSTIISELSDEEKKTLANTPLGLLVFFHHGFGTYIRNNFGLWAYAREHRLGPDMVDYMSMHIIETVWQELQKDASLINVLRDPKTKAELPEEWRNLGPSDPIWFRGYTITEGIIKM